MNLLDIFKRKPAPPREPSVEEGWALRRAELEARLDEIKAEQAEVVRTWCEFRIQHRIVVGRRLEYCGDAEQRRAQLALQEQFLRQRFDLLEAERQKILPELGRLTTNPHETVHREGRLVNA